VLSTIKVLAIISTALFGFYGTFFNLRGKPGKRPEPISVHGWIALAGVFIAAATTAGLQLYTDKQQESSSFTLLSDINRTLHPLAGLKISVRVRPDWSKAAFRPYLDGIERGLDDAGRMAAKMPPVEVLGEKYSLGSLETAFGSYPFADDGSLVRTAICDQQVVLLFYRAPVPTTHFHYAVDGVGEDLEIRLHSPCRFEMATSHDKPLSGMDWDFDRRNGVLHRLDLSFIDTVADPTSRDWRGNGTVTSLQDLLGGQLIVLLYAPMLPSSADVEEGRKAIFIANLIPRMTNGVVLRFDSDNLTAFRDETGEQAYSFMFPATLEELLRAPRGTMSSKISEAIPIRYGACAARTTYSRA
jgi:hypothetical protein